jgi:hypothetical protein
MAALSPSFVCEIHRWRGSLPCPACYSHDRYRQANANLPRRSELLTGERLAVIDPAPLKISVAEWSRREWAIESPAGRATAVQWVPANFAARDLEVLSYERGGHLPGVIGVVSASDVMALADRKARPKILLAAASARVAGFNSAIDRIGPWIGGAMMAGTLLWAWIGAFGWKP